MKWFTDMVKSWNDQNDVKIELDYVPNADYMDGTKLPTAFASGTGPDIFIISPGDFLRYYNGGVLLDLTPFMDDKAKADFPSIIASRRSTTRSTPSRWRSSRWRCTTASTPSTKPG